MGEAVRSLYSLILFEASTMMNTLQARIRGALLGGLVTMAMTAPAQAQLAPAPAPVLSVWTFRGNCVDCANRREALTYPVRATLTLADYLGGALNRNHFVSFRYDGSNLIGPFDVTSANFTSISGNLTTPTQTLTLLFGSGGFFRLATFPVEGNPRGFWDTCPAALGPRGVCFDSAPADYGDNGSFTGPPPTNTVPEPSSYAMMVVGLGALGVVSRRRQRTR
jgi:hypothetical protein